MRKSAAILATAVLGATLSIGSATASMARNRDGVAGKVENSSRSETGVSQRSKVSIGSVGKSSVSAFVGHDPSGVQDYWPILRLSPLHQPW